MDVILEGVPKVKVLLADKSPPPVNPFPAVIVLAVGTGVIFPECHTLFQDVESVLTPDQSPNIKSPLLLNPNPLS